MASLPWIGLLVVIMASLLVWRRLAPMQSILTVGRDDVHFPTVSGNNLERERFVFPRDFQGELNILFVPFLRSQQIAVDSWMPYTQKLEATFADLAYYELPTIDDRTVMFRLFLNEGMRAGIPDAIARQRTVTLYIDTEAFRAATGIPDRREMHILLVNRQGDILWRETGAFSEAKGAGLLAAIQAAR